MLRYYVTCYKNRVKMNLKDSVVKKVTTKCINAKLYYSLCSALIGISVNKEDF